MPGPWNTQADLGQAGWGSSRKVCKFLKEGLANPCTTFPTIGLANPGKGHADFLGEPCTILGKGLGFFLKSSRGFARFLGIALVFSRGFVKNSPEISRASAGNAP